MERNSKVCFLAMDDLSKLIYRMFENWTLSGTPLVVPDCFGLTMEQKKTGRQNGEKEAFKREKSGNG